MAVLTYREAVRQALREELQNDERVLLLDEDIAEFGGSLKVTVGLLDEFGPKRIRNTPISEMAMTEGGLDETIDKIASFIAELIPDGATMQMGIGAIPDAVLGYLQHKRDLGVHSELFSDGVIDLVDSGVLTSARKSIHPGKIITKGLFNLNRIPTYTKIRAV